MKNLTKRDNTKNLLFAISISLLITASYPFKFFNYPFRVELYITFILNYFVGIIFYSSILFLYLKYFTNKKNFFLRLIELIFFYFVFIFFIKTIVLIFGFEGFLSFFLIFDIDIYKSIHKINLLIILSLIFFILFKVNQYIKINVKRFLNSFSLVLILIISYNFFVSNKFFLRSHLDNKYINFQQSKSIPEKKVIFLLFDELDQELLLKKNDELKNFSKLKEISVNFENAFAPGRDTINSVSALLIGHNGKGKLGHFGSEYFFYEKDNKNYINFNRSIFGLVDKENSTLIGSQVITYCMYINIINCSDGSHDIEDIKLKNIFKTITYFSDVLRNSLKKYVPTNEELKTNAKFKKINEKEYLDKKQKEEAKYYRILKNTYKAIKKNDQQIVFIHFPFPHPPSIYANEFYSGANNNKKLDFDYNLNLKFTDYILGNIMKILNENNEQRILLIVTSDHGLRSEVKMRMQEARTVPLIINISNDNSKYIINKKTSSYNIKNLIKKFLLNEINNNYDVVKFFDNTIFVPTTNLNEDLLLKRRNKK